MKNCFFVVIKKKNILKVVNFIFSYYFLKVLTIEKNSAFVFGTLDRWR